MAISYITKEKCIGCKKCVDACPVDVLRWDGGLKQPEIVHRVDCITCFNCELNCSEKAIYVDLKRSRNVVFPW